MAFPLIHGFYACHASNPQNKCAESRTYSVGYDILTVVTTAIALFWNVASPSLLTRYRRFEGIFCVSS
jgi:hypothetical protein